MQKPPLLIIVTGAPASGKTTLARRLAHEIHLPLFVRDDLKESLFDSLGWSDREWSARLGAAAWELLYLVAERMLEAGHSLILESNFQAEWADARIADLQARYQCRIIQILCHAEAEVLLARYQLRAESGERHPGHVDHLNVETLRAKLEQLEPQLNVDGRLLVVDTTDGKAIDYAALVRSIS